MLWQKYNILTLATEGLQKIINQKKEVGDKAVIHGYVKCLWMN